MTKLYVFQSDAVPHHMCDYFPKQEHQILSKFLVSLKDVYSFRGSVSSFQVVLKRIGFTHKTIVNCCAREYYCLLLQIFKASKERKLLRNRLVRRNPGKVWTDDTKKGITPRKGEESGCRKIQEVVSCLLTEKLSNIGIYLITNVFR